MIFPQSPEHRPWKKWKLHQEIQNLAFDLQLLPITDPRGKGFTKVAE